jgi:DNA-binding transcriptional ArsR family regulator
MVFGFPPGRSVRLSAAMIKKAARRSGRTPSRAPNRSVGVQATAAPAPPSRWTFLTNHSHVLILLSQNQSIVLREVAARVGITERAVQRIIADLEEAGFIQREKVGRQNRYRIKTNRPLRHPIEAHRTIGDLVGLI